jgi:hypothetical protein
MKTFWLFCAFLAVGLSAKAVVVDSTAIVTFTNDAGAFPLFNASGATPLLISSTDHKGVVRAFGDLREDIFNVSGHRPALCIDSIPASGKVLIAGTLGKSALIDSLVAKHLIDTVGLTGKWEKYYIQTVAHPLPGIESAVVVVGSDKRGTIFGIYEISEQIGVSPWYWWADVPVPTQTAACILPGTHTRGVPAVKYRGIFLNDEAPALSGWVEQNYGKFNHLFYERVFELILRFKANYLWPAMWGKSFFEDDTINPIEADEYGIVMGTSHHEPMQRAQQDWTIGGTGAWNYETNETVLKDFWKQGITRLGSKEALVTVGMRGDGDAAMTNTTAIPLLERIVSDQRSIIQEVTGKSPNQTPQVWALYKEVQDYYDQGMTVPDDVTLLFSDDNWGNIRRLPAPNAAKRQGGYGVYYHLDYVGGPRSYRWLNTNPLPRIWEQMSLAYDHGVDRIWIVNVGDLKPMELPISFFLDLAWDPKRWSAESIDDYTKLWARQQFGDAFSAPIATFLAQYGKYNGRRKPELIDANSYSLVNFKEAETVVSDYNTLARQVDSLDLLLPSNLKDAYYELVRYPIDACANLNDMYYSQALNKLYATQGRAATSEMADRVRNLFARDAALETYYHTQVANGKWNHMMSQPRIGYTGWDNPSANIQPTVTDLKVSEASNMNVAIEGSTNTWPTTTTQAALPDFDVFQKQTSFIEVFNKGRMPFSYRVETGSPCVQVTPVSGIVYKQQRLTVTINWNTVRTGRDTIPVTIYGPNGKTIVVSVRTFNPESPRPESIHGFVESNGAVAMEAHHFTGKTDSGQNWWQVIPDFGKTGSAITVQPTTSESVTPGGSSPSVSYSVYLFTKGTVTVKAYLAPTINYLGRAAGMRYGISFDDASPQVLSFNGDTDNGRANNIIVSSSTHTLSTTGQHELKFWMVDPGVVLEKLVIETATSKSSYLGPPEKPYALARSLMVTSAGISSLHPNQAMVTFNEDIQSGSVRTTDFTFYSDEVVAPVVEANVLPSDPKTIVFTLSEPITDKARIVFDYTSGSLQSISNAPLQSTQKYMVQYGEAKAFDNPVTSIWLEAEYGQLGSNWVKYTDANASNASYIMGNPANEYKTSASTSNVAYATYTFTVPKSDTYKIWGRVLAPSANDDSFWAKLDNGSWARWNGMGNGTSWVWDDIHDDQVSSNGLQYSLSQGVHTLSICLRENGTALDKLCITNSGTTPAGLGDDASNFPTGLDKDLLRQGMNLEQNYPNPSTESTTIAFTVPQTMPVTLTLYTAQGTEVAVLADGIYAEGTHSVVCRTAGLPKGVYFYCIRTKSFTMTRKMTVQGL